MSQDDIDKSVRFSSNK